MFEIDSRELRVHGPQRTLIIVLFFGRMCGLVAGVSKTSFVLSMSGFCQIMSKDK